MVIAGLTVYRGGATRGGLQSAAGTDRVGGEISWWFKAEAAILKVGTPGRALSYSLSLVGFLNHGLRSNTQPFPRSALENI